MASTQWKSYEEVAAYLLDQFAGHFGLGHFEEKQVVPGDSGAEWEIDAKGYSEDGKKFIVVECKRHTRTGISQAITSALAWSLQDTGASGGILVSPMGLQAGAKKVAARAGIHEVILTQDSTTTDYMLKFLAEVCVGMSEQATATEELTITIRDQRGNVIDTRHG